MSENAWSPDDVPLDKPNPARMYDYYLGGYHNFAIDRAAAEQMIAAMPDTRLFMRAGRAFLRRAVTFLAEQGIDQFLDLGSGIPTVGNVHEVAQGINPAARIVYVDIEPIAVRHIEAILQGNPYARVIQADVRQPEVVLHHPQVRELLDFTRPIGVLLSLLIHFLTEDEEALRVVHAYRDGVPSGSYLAMSHPSHEGVERMVTQRGEQVYARTTTPMKTRSRADIEAFFSGLELVDPGLVLLPLWRPEGPDDILLDEPKRALAFCGVGRKP